MNLAGVLNNWLIVMCSARVLLPLPQACSAFFSIRMLNLEQAKRYLPFFGMIPTKLPPVPTMRL
jgi:hypothetical protein